MDEETPLLGNGENGQRQTDSPLNQLAREPLTPLTRVLFTLVLLFLLLTSILLGLSIGLEQKLAKVSEGYPATTTWTTTFTVIPPSSSVPLPKPSETPPNDDDSVCLRPECVQLAASIIDGLDTSKDPCQDFYEFSNGKWLQHNPIPPGKERYNTLNQIQDRNNLILKRILTENKEVHSPSDSETLTKLRNFYLSCLEESRLNTLGNRPLLDVVITIKKLFNDSESTTASASKQRTFEADSQQGLTATLAYLHSRGINALFQFSFDGDAAIDPNFITLWLSQPELVLGAKEYYQNTTLLDVYISTSTRIFEALDKEGDPDKGQRDFWPPFPWPPWGDDDDDEPEPKKTPQELAKEVVDFETRIAEASLDLVSLRLDPFGTYNPISHEELSELLPQVDFPAYWSSFAPRSYPSKIIVTSKKYLTSLSKLLSNTTPDVVEAYLTIRASLSLAEHLGPETEVWKAHRSLIETLTGTSGGAVQRREEYCITQVTDINTMGLASGRFFVLETFSPDSQTDVRNIAFNIIQTFKESILSVDWMDELSAKAAVEKASNIHVTVGYPTTPDTEDAEAIAKYFSRLAIDESKYFENILNSWTLSTTHKWQLLGKQRDYGRFQALSPSSANTYFDPLANMIVFPAGILQPPYYELNRPGYMKYGAFGGIASHELTHGFDSAGRYYDQNATLRRWWSNATSEAFEKRRACLAKQYSSYTVTDDEGNVIHLNGNLTSNEDISDANFVQAYRTWKKQYVDSFRNGHEYLLPGLNNFTREQLFFIAFARTWTENITPQATLKSILTNSHSLARYRMFGTLVNMPEFAEAFQCPIGSKYNPPDEDRCRFW